jgi:hypothetical protein
MENTDSKTMILYLLGCLAIFQFFNGLYFYRQNRKSDGILLIVSGIFILGVVVKIFML